MTKKIYTESIKKWAIGSGITGGTLIGLIFMYLFAVGAISNVTYSDDMVCAGTIKDPCYAFINFTAEEDIFIYPTGYDPWGRSTLFNFDPNVKSWKLERSWGTSWRSIDLSTNCKATWCGAPDNSGDTTYSVAFRKGKTYQLRITAYKIDPTKNIKWGAFSGVDEIDPEWIGLDVVEVLSDKEYIEEQRTTDTILIDKEKIKEYYSEEKRLKISNSLETLIELKQTTPYINKVSQGKNVIVAEYNLTDYSVEKISDFINFYDINNNYNKLNKNYIWNYKTITDEIICNKEISNETLKEEITRCYHEINTYWTKFETLDELPSKNIIIGLSTDTEIGEYVELIPTIEGFQIFEWTSYLVTNLVAYYKLDEASGTTADNAEGTSAYDGTNTGATVNVDGKIGKCYDFEAGDSDDRVEFGTLTFDPDNMSVSMWIKPESVSALQFFNSHWLDTGNQRGWMMGIHSDNKLRLQVSQTGTDFDKVYYSASAQFSAGNWYHVVMTYNGTTLKGYVNNSLVIDQSYSSGIHQSTGKVRLSSYDGLSGFFEFDGLIDEVRYWSRALTSDEVENLYNNNAPVITANSTSPATVYSNTNWTVNLTATDDSNTYIDAYVQFWINNSKVGGEYTFNMTNNTNHLVATLVSSSFYKTNNLTAEVWVSDGTLNSFEINITATVQNSVPTIPTDIEFNSPVGVGGTITANASGSTDIDEDDGFDTLVYYYQFYNNNDSSAVQEYSTNNTYVVQATDADDIITISAKAYDGTDYSEEYSENITITTTTTDSCTYSSGEWFVECSDNCTISSPVDLGGENITLNGTGIFNVESNITAFDKIIKSNGCQINILSESGYLIK